MKKWIIAGVVMAVGLTACTSAEQAPPQVASLKTGETTAGGNAAPQSGEDKRPRARLDDTPEQVRANSEPYVKCMTENGIHIGGRKGGPVLSTEEYKVVWPKAWEKCKQFYPREPWDYDKNNPDALDFNHRVAECMRRNGAKVVEKPAGPGEDYHRVEFEGDQPQFGNGNGMKLVKKCQLESVRK